MQPHLSSEDSQIEASDTLVNLAPLPASNEALIPAQSISQYTGLSYQTHARWRHEGTGPAFLKLGRRVFYRTGDVRAWMDGNIRSHTSQVNY